jgi:hypothetical protein
MNTQRSMHVYKVCPRKDKRGFDLISDVLPFGRLWYGEPNDAIDYAKFFSRSHRAAFSKKTGATPVLPGRFKNIWRFRRSSCRLLRLPKRIGLKPYLRLSALVVRLSSITLSDASTRFRLA